VAQSTVELIVNAAKAINPLRRVTNETKKLETAVNKAQNGIRNTNKALGRTGKVANNAAKGVNKLGKAVRGLIAGFTVIQGLKFVIFKTAELERQTKSLQVLTGSLGNARTIIKELQEFGAVTPFTSSELIETAKRLKAFGFETEQVVDVTKRLADVAGATGADLGGIATAFGQIQAKGRLQGEELLQLQERGVGLQDELQKMYGLTADEFRKALEGGRISADAVNLALKNITDTGGKYADGAIAQSDTLAGKFSTLVDGIENIARAIGETISPALKFVISDAITAVNFITKAINNAALANNLGLSGDAIVRLQRKADAEAEELVRLRDPKKLLSGFARSGLFNELRQARFRDLLKTEGFRTGQLQAEVSEPQTQSKLPELLQRTGGGKDPAEEAARIAEASADRVRSLEQATLLASALTDEERKQFERQIQIAEILENKRGLTDDQIKAELEATTALFEQQDATEAITKANELRLKQDEALKKKLDEQKQKAKELDDAFRNGIVDAITAAIEGTKSLGDSLLGVIKSMAKLILQQQLLNSLKGFSFTSFLGFANGGRPPVGRPSVVGERGPELFVPDRAGTIIPNHALGSGGGMSTNVTVNVDASGTSVAGNEGTSRQLGAIIGAAVQGEILKQQRPGGLLSR